MDLKLNCKTKFERAWHNISAIRTQTTGGRFPRIPKNFVFSNILGELRSRRPSAAPPGDRALIDCCCPRL